MHIVPPVIIIRTLDSGKLKSGIKCAIEMAERGSGDKIEKGCGQEEEGKRPGNGGITENSEAYEDWKARK